MSSQHVIVNLRSSSLSIGGSLASSMDPESSYRNSHASDRDQRTPSPPVQDEYTPTRQSVHSIIWTTPSQRSNTASISSSTCAALDRVYARVYAADSCRCFVTQSVESLNIAHVVRHASKWHEVSRVLPRGSIILNYCSS